MGPAHTAEYPAPQEADLDANSPSVQQYAGFLFIEGLGDHAGHKSLCKHIYCTQLHDSVFCSDRTTLRHRTPCFVRHVAMLRPYALPVWPYPT